jgi:hypothetical protein
LEWIIKKVQYADDTLIIMPACPIQVAVMEDILDNYALPTGLKINFHKSSLIPINLNNNSALDMAGLQGCNIASMPFTYMGLPLGTTKPNIYDLMPLVDSIERRVSDEYPRAISSTQIGNGGDCIILEGQVVEYNSF